MKLIRRGAKGHGVAVIQHMLRRVGYRSIKIDGDFGPKTQATVKRFQRKYKLSVDGIVGRKTLKKLKYAFRVAVRKLKAKKKAKSKPKNKRRLVDRLPIPRGSRKMPRLPRVTRAIHSIFAHYTASGDVSMATIGRWHRARGFNGPGYHYGIHPNGRIEIGRPLNKTGAHVRGYNVGSIGIVLMGHNKYKWYTTKKQLASLKALTRHLERHLGKKLRHRRHKDVAATTCPGRFSWRMVK